MDQQTPTPPAPPLSDTPTTAAPPTVPDSVDSSPRSRTTNSWTEDPSHSHHPSNNGTTTTAVPPPNSTKLRLMCSYGGHIVPRPHDKTLCYVGGDTRIVVVDRHTTLSDLTHRLNKTLLRSTSTSSFTLKYQLPSEDLDSLISVTTDEDLENMIDEYERLNSNSNSNSDVSKSARIRLFLFPTKPESVSSIGSLLENSTKSEDWFLNALNGTTSGFSDTSSVNCLLGLDDDVSVPEKKEVEKNPKTNNSGQDVHSVPDLERLERTSSFGSASSSPSLASLPPIKVHVEDSQKVGGIEEQFVQMTVQSQLQKVQDDVAYVPVPAPVVVSGVPSDSASSDGRQKPGVIYQDQLVKMPSSNNNNNNITDQSPRIQMQQHVSDPAYVMSMSNAQVQQPQFIHTAVPQPQYIHHHPSGAVPMTSYYQIYPSQNQHHVHHQPQTQPLDQQNFVYYMPARQVPSSQHQFVQVPSSQHQGQPQPQYVGYSQMHHQPQSVASGGGGGGNYGYEFSDPGQGQPMYYAAQSNAQYQTVTGESGSYLAADNGTKQQQGRSQQQP